MGKTIRFGISLDSELLDKFDALCEEKCYQTRSEAIRDLIRNTLVEEEWKDLDKEMVGTLTLVYDHHQSDLAQKITEIQHVSLDVITVSMHIHLDHHNCMEVLILRGGGEHIRKAAQRLISTKGVKYGKLNLSTMGKELT
ncbi:MAG: nickel-responsive transcriptional regulator NikR [Deltaproteobacteria bacterium]|nr:MAG: nickel-responsive transcriptional regulator NikR [Deltaproteobacteria bacterium]